MVSSRNLLLGLGAAVLVFWLQGGTFGLAGRGQSFQTERGSARNTVQRTASGETRTRTQATDPADAPTTWGEPNSDADSDPSLDYSPSGRSYEAISEDAEDWETGDSLAGMGL